MGNLAINGGAQIDYLLDQNGNRVLDVQENTGLLVNYFTIVGSAATQSPVIAVAGNDTNLHACISGKGSGGVISNVNTPTTAGGLLGFGMGASFMGIYFGSGVPTVSAPKGSLYLRSDGSSTSTRAYINTDGATTWTAITTAA